jgi:hypothetical protein
MAAVRIQRLFPIVFDDEQSIAVRQGAGFLAGTGIAELASTIYSFQLSMLQDWQVDANIVLRLLIAMVLSGLVGWDREHGGLLLSSQGEMSGAGR